MRTKTNLLIEHCGHCPEDYARWVRRFPEESEETHKLRLEKAARDGLENMKDDELTPVGQAQKRKMFLNHE